MKSSSRGPKTCSEPIPFADLFTELLIPVLLTLSFVVPARPCYLAPYRNLSSRLLGSSGCLALVEC